MKAVDAPVHQSETSTTSQTTQPWSVVIQDDPVNLMEYVSRVITRVFGYSREKANELMMLVHQKGKAIVWRGNREEGEMYVSQLHRAQLQARLEKSR